MKIRPCAHTIPIQDNGTHGVGGIDHNVLSDTSVDPDTARSNVNGRLAPPRAVTPDVELPDSATTGVTETGSLYSPSVCESDYS